MAGYAHLSGIFTKKQKISGTIRSKFMKYIVIFCLCIVMAATAGCISGQAPASPTTVPAATPVVTPLSSLPGLPMGQVVKVNNGSYVFDASITSIEASMQDDIHIVDVNIAVNNTGRESFQLVWFSRLTDRNGKEYGGIGVSHNGSGARGVKLHPGLSNLARDYVTVLSPKGFSELSKGATLNVVFFNQTPYGYGDKVANASWSIPGGVIR
jgi:hypothetical protein